MSTEAVVTKTMWLLGNYSQREEIEKNFYKNLAGELRIPETILLCPKTQRSVRFDSEKYFYVPCICKYSGLCLLWR